MLIHSKHLSTIAVHGGTDTGDNLADVTQPIHLSTTFERNPDGSVNEYNYTRAGNPNREAVEKKISSIEGSKTAITFSSGLAAINALLENILKPGSHILIPDDCYHGTRTLIDTFLKRWEVSFDEVDMTDVAKIEQAITKNTLLILIETPSNPQLKITDLGAVVKLAEAHNILTACDNTFATPILQKPLEMGIDYVMYSSTKFFSGHSDILGGVLTTNREDAISLRIREYQKVAGAVPSPFDCWLLNRSLSTLPLRFTVQCANAAALADFLEGHDRIKKVFYPGLASHENHHIAKKQMQNGYGSIISILVDGNQPQAFEFAGKLNLFKHATSLGGVESLVEHRRSVEGDHPISPENLIRISVGIEHIDDLIADIKQALG